jgi:hypothetical protein
MTSPVNDPGIKNPSIPRAVIGGATRPRNGGDGDIVVRNLKTGDEVRLNRANARDLVENVGGWKIVSHGSQRPLGVVAKPAPDEGEGEGEDNGEGATGSDNEPAALDDPAIAELNKFRAQAAELGIAVDQRWGKRRLAEEIAKKTGAA